MHYDLLARFIFQSSNWSNLKRGREIFYYSAELFKDLFQIDSGFFLYKKRIPSELSNHLQIFNSWGVFHEPTESLQFCLDTNMTILENFLNTRSDQWINVKDVPIDVDPHIKQLGIWKLSSRGETIGAVILARCSSKPTDDENVLSICAKQISLILDMMLSWRVADEMCRYDLQTGVLNRRGIFDMLDTLISNANRSGSILMIGLIDIDNFKQINDCYGHPEGDRILLEVAETLQHTIRSGDLIGRLGGDEFVLIMQTKNQNTGSVEERIIELFPPSGGYTISVGFAALGIDGNDWDTCYKIADQRLYKKKFGKKPL